MSCVIIVGPKGVGKTKTCLDLAERVSAEGLSPRGIVSPAVFVDGEKIGYDCLDMASGVIFPLVRLRNMIGGPSWFPHGNIKYAFSVPGFERANRLLTHSAQALGEDSLVFVDEFGRLEMEGMGFYSGAVRVAETLNQGGVAVFACRTDALDAVKELVVGSARDVKEFESGTTDVIWRYIRSVLSKNSEPK
jgi:nucleoside-triphosphatase THEP1